MFDLAYDYASCVRDSEKAAWRLDEAMPPETKLDFTRPFLPEALALTNELPFLNEAERRKLNQIAGNSYLNLFAFVEEYILATMTQHAAAELFGDHTAIRALSRFVDEEVKHQMLFQRFKTAFARDFGSPCKVLESAVAVAGVIMKKSPIAVMITTLHIELMTMQHYVECVKDEQGLDPLFAKLLKLHWVEESQHAKIDALELDKLLDTAPPALHKKGFDDYLDIVAAFDGLLGEQASFDLGSLEGAAGRTFSEAERAQIKAVAHKAYRKTFLTYGMRNPTFASLLRKVSPSDHERVLARAKELD